jgi:dihydrofolate synthase/folylpolyglutamate synthase
MTYESARAYLVGTINETASRRMPNRLDRMRQLLRNLGDPQERYATVHVGGTSGKGSTATMIAAALEASGRRTGLHTKPHLKSMTERARVNGLPVSPDDFGETLSEMMPAIEATTAQEGRPTYYETLLALAFVWFAKCEVDSAVIEVGLGGTLDGTNVLRPKVTVVTNSGIDHTDVLGETIEEIAADEAGIAKPAVPLVAGATVAAARETIERICAEVGAPFVYVDDAARIAPRPSEPYGQSFDVTTARGRYELSLPVLGRFQQRNASTAIVALEALPEAMRPSISQVESAFANLVIPGRMEFFPAHPSVVFDIAHNADKARALADALVETFGERRFRFVIAVGESKDPRDVLNPFLELRASYTFTSFETPGRTAIRPQRLAGIAEAAGVWGRAIGDPIEALSIARRDADPSDIIVVTGSTFVVATLRDWWLTNVAARSAG